MKRFYKHNKHKKHKKNKKHKKLNKLFVPFSHYYVHKVLTFLFLFTCLTILCLSCLHVPSFTILLKNCLFGFLCFLLFLFFFMLFMLFMLIKSFHKKKIKRLEIGLITSITILLMSDGPKFRKLGHDPSQILMKLFQMKGIYEIRLS